MPIDVAAVRESAEGAFGAVAFALEAAALLIVVVAATRELARTAVAFARRDREFHRIRLDFGKALVLALEFLVAADILKTALAPTRDQVVVLAIVVAIRTVLAITLERDLRQAREGEPGRR